MPSGGARPNSGPKKGYKLRGIIDLNLDAPPTRKVSVSPVPAAQIIEKQPAADPLVPAPTINAIRRRKTPLERLYEAMANPKIPWASRIRAMGLAAEYVHAKQPQAIHLTQETRLEAVVVHVHHGPWNAAVPSPALPPAPPPETPN